MMIPVERTPIPGLKHSWAEPNGRGGTMIFTACCECNRGGNGNAEHKCSSGGYITKWDKLGCWCGEPILLPERQTACHDCNIAPGGCLDDDEQNNRDYDAFDDDDFD